MVGTSAVVGGGKKVQEAKMAAKVESLHVTSTVWAQRCKWSVPL